jgi:hypothetical protein
LNEPSGYHGSEHLGDFTSNQLENLWGGHNFMSSKNNQTPQQTPDFLHEEISLRAYQLWQERGCPIGSPEEDWFRAEQEISSETGQSAETAGSVTAKAQAASV